MPPAVAVRKVIDGNLEIVKSRQKIDEPNSAVEAEIDTLRSMPIVELRALWRTKFKSEPPMAFGPDLLRRSVAQKIQETAYGSLDAATTKLLNQLMVQHAK